jgi:hypothetical protein
MSGRTPHATPYNGLALLVRQHPFIAVLMELSCREITSCQLPKSNFNPRGCYEILQNTIEKILNFLKNYTLLPPSGHSNRTPRCSARLPFFIRPGRGSARLSSLRTPLTLLVSPVRGEPKASRKELTPSAVGVASGDGCGGDPAGAGDAGAHPGRGGRGHRVRGAAVGARLQGAAHPRAPRRRRGRQDRPRRLPHRGGGGAQRPQRRRQVRRDPERHLRR